MGGARHTENPVKPERQDWTDRENDLLVADYFAMLNAELAGEGYNKAGRNRALQQLIGRGRGSIEFKHQNVSAVLKLFGQPWIDGYKPAFNFQSTLRDAVWRWLSAKPAWPTPRSPDVAAATLAEPAMLDVGPSPTQSNEPEPEELTKAKELLRLFDIAGRDAANRVLGAAGEQRVFCHEKATLRQFGQSALADEVRWVSRDDGDGAGYDIASFDAEGRRRLIEVKTTNGWNRTPFHITANELKVADERRSEWVLFRLWNFARKPQAFELRPPLDAHVSLTATSFRATFPT